MNPHMMSLQFYIPNIKNIRNLSSSFYWPSPLLIYLPLFVHPKMSKLQILHDQVTNQSYQIISVIRLGKKQEEASLYLVKNPNDEQTYVAKVADYSILKGEYNYYEKLLPYMPGYLPRLPQNPLNQSKGAFIMEYIPYSLEQIKDTMPISPEQVYILGKLLLQLLQKLHSQNIVHGDLKPGNILSRTLTINDNTNLVLILVYQRRKVDVVLEQLRVTAVWVKVDKVA